MYDISHETRTKKRREPDDRNVRPRSNHHLDSLRVFGVKYITNGGWCTRCRCCPGHQPNTCRGVPMAVGCTRPGGDSDSRPRVNRRERRRRRLRCWPWVCALHLACVFFSRRLFKARWTTELNWAWFFEACSRRAAISGGTDGCTTWSTRSMFLWQRFNIRFNKLSFQTSKPDALCIRLRSAGRDGRCRYEPWTESAERHLWTGRSVERPQLVTAYPPTARCLSDQV